MKNQLNTQNQSAEAEGPIDDRQPYLVPTVETSSDKLLAILDSECDTINTFV